MNRRFALALVGAVLATGAATAPTAVASPGCAPSRFLVLSAMPVELDPLLAQAKIDQTVVVGQRTFYVGTLEGKDVVLALTGIGMVNATQTTQAALQKFPCIDGALFSGTAGGDYIGDVTVPFKWTKDDGKTWFPAAPGMLATARKIAGSVQLEQSTPPGDAVCAGSPADPATPITVQHAPKVEIGGLGSTSDPFGGRNLPCVPYGGDVFGCAPCTGPSDESGDVAPFVTGAAPFVDPTFFSAYNQWQSSQSSKYAASDMETGAVASVLAEHHVPFIGFRAASDGGGDPLSLPGFPVQFFVYRQLAADNAAKTALAFLQAWSIPKH